MKRKSRQNGLSQQVVRKIIKQALTPLQNILAQHFLRSETKDPAFAYLQGLISVIERKNSWRLSEEIGYSNPYAFQYLLGRALWDPNNLRDEVCR